MYAVQLNVHSDKLELLLSIIQNLKDDIIESININNKSKEPSKRLLKAMKEVESGNVVYYRSNDPVAEMMRDLKA